MKRLRWLDRASEGEREKGKGGSYRALWAARGLRFSPSGRWEPWRAVGRGVGPGSGAHRCPLAALGRTGSGGPRRELWVLEGGNCADPSE